MLEISSVSEIKRSEGLHFEALGQAQTQRWAAHRLYAQPRPKPRRAREQSLYFQGQVQRIDLDAEHEGSMVELTDQWFDFDPARRWQQPWPTQNRPGPATSPSTKTANGQIDNGKELFGPQTKRL